jgi:hypothetical protein
MGWSAGKGLGRTMQGRTEPVRIDEKHDALGIGRRELEV